MGDITKGLAGVEDLKLKTSGTTRQAFSRDDSTGRPLTLNQLDAADLQFRSLALTVDDLVDGGADVAIKPKAVGASGSILPLEDVPTKNLHDLFDGGYDVDIKPLETATRDLKTRGPWVDARDFLPLGFVTDGSVDYSSQFQAAVDYADANGVNMIRCDHKASMIWGFGSSVSVPVGKYLISGRSVVFKPLAGFTGTYMFLFNALEADASGFVTGFPNQICGGMQYGYFDNVDEIAGVKAIKFAGSHTFEDMRFRKYVQSINKDSAAYSDCYTLRNIHIIEPITDAEFQIDLPGQGDGMLITQIAFPNTNRVADGFPEGIKGIDLVLANSARVDQILGGTHRFALCKDLDANVYIEHGNVEIDSCSGVLTAHIYKNDGLIPIVFKKASAGSFSFKLKDCLFNTNLSDTPTNDYDVQVASSTEIIIDNCKQITTSNGKTDPQFSGIRMVESDGTTPLSEFNNLSYLNSQRSVITTSLKVMKGIESFDTGAGSFTGITSAAVGTFGAWNDTPSITYYYRARLLVDPVREVGRNGGGEVSVAVGTADKAVDLAVAFGVSVGGIIRVYRGTSTGSYDMYADIHVAALTKLHDMGDAVNGQDWIARGAAAMDTTSVTPTKIHFEGDEAAVWVGGASNPAAGTWKQGDRIVNQTPSVDGNNMVLIGRVCTAAGTPGTHSMQQVSTVSPAT